MTRTLTLTSPHMRGDDVRRVQRTLGVTADSDWGPNTQDAAERKARRLGVSPYKGSPKAGARRTKVLLGARRTPVEIARARRIKAADAKRSRGIAHAKAWARSQVGTRENPAGSNSGGKITTWLRGVGIGAAPWCGAFAHANAKEYGVQVTQEIRYCPWAEAHARAGTGGLQSFTTNWKIASGWVDEDRLVFALYNFGSGIAQHISGAVLGVTDTETHDIEGNTSSGNQGSQDNGGMVAERHRSNSLVKGWILVRKPS
jgi:hypothetical protein